MKLSNEDLEMIGRAADLRGGEWRETLNGISGNALPFYYISSNNIFNPNNTGTLLELAVRLHMNILTGVVGVIGAHIPRVGLRIEESVKNPGDYLDATKRAILKAAIQFGRYNP